MFVRVRAVAAAEDVKQVFLADTLPICRDVLCSDLNDPEMVSAIETAVSAPRDAAAALLSCVINLSEVNISEVKNLACKPLAGDVEVAQKILQTALPDRPAQVRICDCHDVRCCCSCDVLTVFCFCWQRNPNEASKDALDGGDVWDEGPDTDGTHVVFTFTKFPRRVLTGLFCLVSLFFCRKHDLWNGAT